MLLAFVVAYLLLTIAVGLWAAKRVKSTEDFAVAGRHLPLTMIVTTTFATWFGSETVLGIPAKFVEGGLKSVVEDPFGAGMCAIYVVLGTVMEELSMVLLTLPVFFPVVVQLGIDPVWFGILVVTVVEIGLISPPVDMNLFVLKTLLPQVGTATVFRGVLPFMAADCVRLAMLIAFPSITLWLPGLLH
jgi:TRAP-type C4-dicarboxylate transport system permease large subunit